MGLPIDLWFAKTFAILTITPICSHEIVNMVTGPALCDHQE